jgi:hypothetical protein
VWTRGAATGWLLDCSFTKHHQEERGRGDDMVRGHGMGLY